MLLANALKLASPLRATPLSKKEEEIFERSLLETSQYISRAAAELPGFQEAQAAYSIELLQNVSGEVAEALDDLRAIREVVTRTSTDEKDFEVNYRNALVAKLDKVELFGVELPPELQEAKLTDAYVTLRITSPITAVSVEDENTDDVATAVSVETAFAGLGPNSGRLLIRGGAGCGKTTLVRWAAIQAARITSPENRTRPEFERDESGEVRILDEGEQLARESDWRTRMPFVISLRNCPNGKLPSAERFPTEITQEIGNPVVQKIPWALGLVQLVVMSTAAGCGLRRTKMSCWANGVLRQ